MLFISDSLACVQWLPFAQEANATLSATEPPMPLAVARRNNSKAVDHLPGLIHIYNIKCNNICIYTYVYIYHECVYMYNYIYIYVYDIYILIYDIQKPPSYCDQADILALFMLPCEPAAFLSFCSLSSLRSTERRRTASYDPAHSLNEAL